MKMILTFCIFLSLGTVAQNLSFNKVMTYYISKDEELILNDLKQKKYLIQKEQAAEVALFDTQINCFKVSESDYSKMTGLIIFKSTGQIFALSYFTFNLTDFQNKLKEISKRGFDQTVENPTTHWIFEKKDTVIAGEKKIITLMNKEFTRYELTITAYPNSSGSMFADIRKSITINGGAGISLFPFLNH